MKKITELRENFCFKRIKSYLSIAYENANIGMLSGNVPVGAVLVMNDKVIAKSYNGSKCFEHAEIICLQDLEKKLNDSKYLHNCELFVTLEPCDMCFQVILASRIKSVFFANFSPKIDFFARKEALKRANIGYFSFDTCQKNDLNSLYRDSLLKEFFLNMR
jgi:tRNA(adenine34) deaminase